MYLLGDPQMEMTIVPNKLVQENIKKAFGTLRLKKLTQQAMEEIDEDYT